jgi:enoyl-CoA hydratase/carnithine racemase
VPHTQFIVLRGSSGTAFSYGPDIRKIYECVTSKELTEKEKEILNKHTENSFFMASKVLRETYKLIFYLAYMKTPVIALLNGHIVNGGAGIGCYSNYAVATDSTMFSSPGPCNYYYYYF